VNLPSSTDLTYFAEVARQKNLSKAARHLGISQPSVTLAVQRLEHCVGTALLYRSRQGVALTKAGEKLFSEIQEFLGQWQRLRQDALDSVQEVQGLVRLGCHPSVGRYALPSFLPKLLQLQPRLEISITHNLSRHIVSQVVALELDLGIVVNPKPHPDLVVRALTKDSVRLWQVKNLQNVDVLICEPSLAQTQYILSRLNRSGLKISRYVESSNLEVIASLAEAGAGLAILPTRVAMAQSRKLIPVTESPFFNDEICLVYRTENRTVRAIQEVSRAIQAGFAKSIPHPV